jgi:hypothetical protein
MRFPKSSVSTPFGHFGYLGLVLRGGEYYKCQAKQVQGCQIMHPMIKRLNSLLRTVFAVTTGMACIARDAPAQPRDASSDPAQLVAVMGTGPVVGSAGACTLT